MSRAGKTPAWEWRLDRAVLALARTPWGRSGYGRARGLMRLFVWIEHILLWGHHLAPLREDSVVRYEVGPYPGRAVRLANGTLIRHGERAILLHWDNRALASSEAAGASRVQRLTWQLAKRAGADLQCLADLVRDGTIPAGVRTIWAETVHYQLLPRYGFSVRPAPPSFRTPWARLFMLCMLTIYSRPGQLDDERVFERLQLGEGWLSVDDLLGRYPARGREPEARLQTGRS